MNAFKKIFATFCLACTISFSFSQCGTLTGNDAGMDNWKKKYSNYWGVDSTVKLIKTDSILIYYITNEANQTSENRLCCYQIAEKYAQLELAATLKQLYHKFNKTDSAALVKTQTDWEKYAVNEYKFFTNAFLADTTNTTTHQKADENIRLVMRQYENIKNRILVLKGYNEFTYIPRKDKVSTKNTPVKHAKLKPRKKRK